MQQSSRAACIETDPAGRARSFVQLGLCLTGIVIVAAGLGPRALAARTQSGTAAASAASIHVTVTSPTHAPKANAAWPVRVTVTGPGGKKVAASLSMVVLFSGQQVGTIDKGAVYRFTGTWQERKGNEITWPAASLGAPLTLQFIVKANGVTVRKNWAITVR